MSTSTPPSLTRQAALQDTVAEKAAPANGTQLVLQVIVLSHGFQRAVPQQHRHARPRLDGRTEVIVFYFAGHEEAAERGTGIKECTYGEKGGKMSTKAEPKR